MEYYFLIKGRNRYSAILQDGSTYTNNYEWQGNSKRLYILDGSGFVYEIKQKEEGIVHKMYAIGGNFRNSMSSNVIQVKVRNREARGKLKGRLLEPRCNCTAVICKDELYVIGGVFDAISINSVEKYDKARKRFCSIPPINIPRQCASACAYSDCIYVAGGSNEFGYLSSIEKYDGRAWVVLDVTLPYPMLHFYLAPLYESKLLVWGGRASNRKQLKELWSIDLFTGLKCLRPSALGDCFRYPGRIEYVASPSAYKPSIQAVTLNSESRIVCEPLFSGISSVRKMIVFSSLQLESFSLI
jgi:hypothetical protein